MSGGALYTSAKRPGGQILGGTNFRGDIVHYDTGYDSPLSYTILIIIPFCIIVEIDGSEISLYTA